MRKSNACRLLTSGLITMFSGVAFVHSPAPSFAQEKATNTIPDRQPATHNANASPFTAESTERKTLIDYFLPTPVVGSLSKDAWGAANVLPRDQQNGLEDTTIKQWCYWDGQIIKGPEGKYHMFASRWDQAKGHNGWGGSVAVHAVSDRVNGPYIDQGPCWPENQGGKGHNVTALVLPDKTYAIVVSETHPAMCSFPNRSMVRGNSKARLKWRPTSSAAWDGCRM